MSPYQPVPSDALTDTSSSAHNNAGSPLSPVVRLGSIDNLETALAQSWLDVSRATYHFLTLLREFEMRQGFKAYGCNDCAEWLDFKLKISRTTALEKIRVAKALWFVPKIEAAFKQGKLSYSQVRALTRVADRNNESSLLTKAFDTTAEALERHCRQLKQGDAQAAQAQANRQFNARSLHVHVEAGEISVKLTPEELALLQQVLEQLVTELPLDSGRDYFAARADALVELVRRHQSGAGTGKGVPADTHQVLVHIDATALEGLGGKSDLPHPVVKRLCCDGSVVPILKRGDEVLSVGRKTRTVPTTIQRALAVRDHACRFPGCHHSQLLEAHHIHHWCVGGETSLDNLIQLCSHHHRLLHEGGFSLRARS